ncbi:MAG: hypothetical protein IT323_22435 [Anaerolineae bacterium]|nr:hypothetical protein [Anaerolineae bacterium]
MFAKNDWLNDQPDDSAPPDLEQLDHGVSVEWIEGRRIVVFYTPHSSRPAVQTLFDRAEAVLHAWPADRPFLAILDFAEDKLGATSYARERGQKLIQMRPDIKLAIAMLTSPSVIAQFMQVIAHARQRENRLLSILFSRDEAVGWLKKVGGIQ